ncbi:hypothetical protein A3C57_02705 [Candidatus Nomurabacteria bacterium RIFCSPHIGHO2_02_FULL_33_12]|uniref:DUF5678 domain-containing protein n=1 Tax=Candidatus Nomurabacteria bacterium RIFCSPLOWO2_01_FULL_33_17 TaxID=1801764 RepID=A0A1F6WNU1_9BACT|nr:MAG: hypothetical protein A3C57_02705 [Candidatus Nomurabacteria bacterium RIFCSPHIGHO2_02_FULL_33_12]OGI83572.1 MAG: hypothetical protein A2903_02535 [Candidatus Nomurabacteria bacterium RIFCSPLOWO2_01_FULL_33_17]
MQGDWTKIYKKYKGLWVALDHDEQTVLGVGKTVKDAINAAKKKTIKTPFLTRVPLDLNTFVGLL